MSLFQKSVLADYLKNSFNEEDISVGWGKMQEYQEMSSKIRTFKEEVFQSDFLRKIFVDCLGYKSQYESVDDGNLFFEEKNLTDTKKADGAIKIDGDVRVVIELKGTNTKDLKSVENQAFGYKSKHPKCEYVVTSNFEKLRFYINDAVDYEEFDLFNLSRDDFKLLHICLHKDNIFSGTPKKLKNDSVLVEETITKKLYNDYSSFRRELFKSLVKSNTDYDKLVLFNKTQKLLDRFLFILFAEDRHLLPANSISEIIKVWESDRSFYGQKSLYEVYKGYFKVLNNGRPASEGREAIFAYNGGLFADDEILDSIEIQDDILLTHTKKLTRYDFQSDISVNILGHIFEHSLSEIEEIQNKISGLETETSKRKKDGIFYTPQYITKYMVESTLGKLCVDKKRELNINEETYAPSNKRSREKIQNLDNYRNWLLKLTICDPACGSGAFLNQALSFLIDEHKYIDKLSASYNRDSITLSDVKNSILENNLFGVDINQESIEIAKLSLWLRTADKGRKLTSLSNNIKCGNSLIDDPSVAAEKAFNWEKQFPKVFAEGGFDIVIGNPPYVAARNMNENEREYLSKKYKELRGAWDLYVPFLLLGEDISKYNCVSWIIPNKLLISDYAIKAFERLKLNGLNKVINISSLPIFKNVGVYPIILISSDKADSFTEYKIEKVENLGNLDNYVKGVNIFKRFKSLKDFNVKINSGTTGFEAKKIIPLINETKSGYKFAVSGSIDPYTIERERVPYMKSIYKQPYIKLDKNLLADSKIEFWSMPKIVVAGMTKRIEAYFSAEPLALGVGVYGIYDFSNFAPKYILGLLNSKFLTYYLNIEFYDKHLAGGYLAINKSTLEQMPLVEAEDNNVTKMVSLVDEIIKSKVNLASTIKNFQNYIISQYMIEKASNKLKNWYQLEFIDFTKELNKAIKKSGRLPLDEKVKFDLMSLFDEQKNKAQSHKLKIDKTNNEIDQLVYELYGLSKEEIEIVENS